MLRLFLGLAACIMLSVTAAAQESESGSSPFDPATIVKVEEDWIVYVQNPDAELGAPQIVNVLAPTPSTETVFGMIELNHQSQPSFRKGGIQVQSWVGGQWNDLGYSDAVVVLNHTYDKLTYTVGMSRADQKFKFYVRDGRSKTWGKFAETPISAEVPDYQLDLSTYDPQYSVDNTAISVGAHRVVLMYQREVRYYTEDGLEYTDETDRVIHRFQDVVQFVSLEEYEQNLSQFNIEITEQ